MEKSSEVNSNLNDSGRKSRRLQEVLLFLLTVAGSGLASYLYKRTEIQTAGLMILAAVGIVAVIFSIEQAFFKGSLLFDNGEHLMRFTFLYFVFLCGSLLFPLLPVGGWPYLAVFIGLMIFSNQVVGISAGTVLLMITSLLYGGNGSEFFIYFIVNFNFF